MQEVIDKLKAEGGLTDEQAQKAIAAIKDFVVEKFPMLEGAVGSLFGQEKLANATAFSTAGVIGGFKRSHRPATRF